MTAQQKDRRINFAICALDAIGFPLGIAFFAPTTILPTFLRHLHASDIVIGALIALSNLLAYVPGLLIVRHLRRQTRVRGLLFWIALVERLFLLALAPLTLWWGTTRPDWLIAATFVCLAGHNISIGLNMPTYYVLIGKTIPLAWRGRLYGYSGALAGLCGIGVERLLQTVVLAGPRGGFPEGYAAGFAIGFAILTVSYFPLGWAREPRSEPETPERPEPLLDIEALRRIWRDDSAFRRFLRAQILYYLTGMAAPFFVLHATESLGAPVSAVAGYTAATILASSIGSLGIGWVADRHGNRAALLVGSACCLAAFVLALTVRTPLLFYGVFVAMALAGAGTGIAGFNLVLEYAGEAREIGRYTSFFNLMTALPRALGPLLGGVLARTIGYTALFSLCVLLALGAAALTWRIPRPRVDLTASSAAGQNASETSNA